MVFAPQHWSPQLRPWVIRWLRPLRLHRYSQVTQLNPVQVQGAENLSRALASGQRVLLTANHASHADPYGIFEACISAGTPCHIMAAWHIFAKNSLLMRWFLQWHGCFSVDREANDLTAFREAVAVLRARKEPLLIFPEGDIYHCNEQLTPFREGAAAIAIAAAKRSAAPVVVIPTAIRYKCAGDPMPGILEVLESIERRILWRPRPERPVVERIWAIGDAVLGLKEQEFYGHSKRGALPLRIGALAADILTKLERQHDLPASVDSVPKRVKLLRHAILSQLHDQSSSAAERARLRIELDDAFEALQLFSYPGDYLEGEPSLERIAETVDKLEEDVLQRTTASIRCRRDVFVDFGEPMAVAKERSRSAAVELTLRIQSAVEELLKTGFQACDPAISPKQQVVNL